MKAVSLFLLLISLLPATAMAKDQWEYLAVSKGKIDTEFAHIHYPDKTITATTITGLLKQLQSGEDNNPDGAPLNKLFNILGREGWELIYCDYDRYSGDCTFKRRVQGQ